MTNPGQVLVLGLGNIILQDEGLGVWALERLQARYQFADHVR
jgi:Ni,Fe-hydrogenase maturation factor